LLFVKRCCLKGKLLNVFHFVALYARGLKHFADVGKWQAFCRSVSEGHNDQGLAILSSYIGQSKYEFLAERAMPAKHTELHPVLISQRKVNNTQ
jgi:hypothetical protein